MEKTPYNHGGRLRHASACADEAIDIITSQLVSLKKERSLYAKPIMQVGEANRLNDYARTLQAHVNNLVHFLEHAGAQS